MKDWSKERLLAHLHDTLARKKTKYRRKTAPPKVTWKKGPEPKPAPLAITKAAEERARRHAKRVYRWARWRHAIYLREVEGLTFVAMGPRLGVTPVRAAQIYDLGSIKRHDDEEDDL